MPVVWCVDFICFPYSLIGCRVVSLPLPRCMWKKSIRGCNLRLSITEWMVWLSCGCSASTVCSAR